MEIAVPKIKTEIFPDDEEIILREDLEDAEKQNIVSEKYHMNWSEDYKTAKEYLKDKQYKKAFDLFQAEAQKNNVIAIYSIAKMYHQGLLGRENVIKAQEYFAETLKGFLALESSAGKMQPYIWYQLGRLYNFGYGTEKNYFEAFKWYKKAADKGNAYACYETAKMLQGSIGTENSLELAESYFENAYKGFCKTQRENLDDKILYRLGVMTLKGLGCETDRDHGIEYIRQSAELGNEYAKIFFKNTDRYNAVAIQNAVISMLFSFGRLISDDYNRSLRQQNMRTEHKLKSAI